MEGLSDVQGWRRVFMNQEPFLKRYSWQPHIIKGLLTQVVAIGVWFLIIGFPDKVANKSLLNTESLLCHSENRKRPRWCSDWPVDTAQILYTSQGLEAMALCSYVHVNSHTSVCPRLFRTCYCTRSELLCWYHSSWERFPLCLPSLVRAIGVSRS